MPPDFPRTAPHPPPALSLCGIHTRECVCVATTQCCVATQHSSVWPQHRTVLCGHTTHFCVATTHFCVATTHFCLVSTQFNSANRQLWGLENPEKRGIWHERGRQATDRAETDIILCESHARRERPGNLPAPFRGPWGAQGPKKPVTDFGPYPGPFYAAGVREAQFTLVQAPFRIVFKRG